MGGPVAVTVRGLGVLTSLPGPNTPGRRGVIIGRKGVRGGFYFETAQQHFSQKIPTLAKCEAASRTNDPREEEEAA